MTVRDVPVVSDPRYANPLTSSMAGFLASIGLETAPVVRPEAGFLDGLMISHGVLLIDEVRLAYPGDLLHEGGHLAVIPSAQRKLLYGNAGSDPGEEMAAIAWSYAAALYLGIDPAVVFPQWLFRRFAGHLAEFFPGTVLRRANAGVVWPYRRQKDRGAPEGFRVSPYAEMVERLMD
jgi:hypothetical protein